MQRAPVEKLRPICDAHFDIIAPFTSGTHNRDDHWNDFRVAWERVRYPGDFDLMKIAEAVKGREPHPACAAKGYSAPARVFLVGLCAELQALQGDNPFFLSSDKGAEVLRKIGLPKKAMDVYRTLIGLCGDGVLRVAEKGTKKKATRYQFIWQPDDPTPTVSVPEWLMR